MNASGTISKSISIFLGIYLLRGTPIRPIISIFHNSQDYHLEDMNAQTMGEKIAEIEKELANASSR